ncbi:NTP/NDP exchange transporter [Pseudomonadota bacterium]
MPDRQNAGLLAWFCSAVNARPEELRALLYSFAYFFCLLCSYYVLRPIRDEMGIQGGVDNLQWLFTATFAAMLCAVPLFGWVSSRFARAKLLPVVYGFFILNILLYEVGAVSPANLARVFFVWVSVFNLFVVSVFWSFMVDVFDGAQAKRLFGFIAAGGSAGAITGPALTTVLVGAVGPVNLLPVSAIFLGAALFCVYRLRNWASGQDGEDAGALGGGLFDGMLRVARSPYLLGICVYILLFTTTSTFLYFLQAGIVSEAFTDSADRTRAFAMMDLATNGLTVSLQLFVTGRLATRRGLPFLLALVPGIVMAGFVLISISPVFIVIALVQILRRAGNYAIARPGREMCFSVLARDDKYKSKNFIDTVVYRGGDAVSGWAYAGMAALGTAASGIAVAGAAVAAVWLVTGWKLGRARERLETKEDGSAVNPRLLH